VIGADHVSYNDMHMPAGRVSWIGDPPSVGRFPDSEKILGAYMLQNPLIAHFATHRDDRCLRISDFVSVRTFQRTSVYNEFYRKLGTQYQFGTLFPARATAPVGVGIGIALNRGRRDFNERDRAVLSAIRPHLVQGYRNAHQFTELQRDVASITAGVDSLRVAIILLNDDGNIRLMTRRAPELLAAYFAVRGAPRETLPDTLDRWVKRHGALIAGRVSVATPYVVERDARHLIVRLIVEHRATMLLMSEEQSGADRRALQGLGLTEREAEVLSWLAEGKRDQEIATILGISPRTVQHHLARVYEKLGVETRSAAIAIALRAARGGLPV
jgi:DNA-binding CsgD family transcriptional regulator